MATRLYFPAECTATVTPAVNGSYNYTSELVTRHLATCKTGTALTDGVRVGPWTINQTAIGEAWVSPPLSGAGTLSGTWKAQLRSREYNASDDAYTAPEIYVVSGDGSTVRGTAWAIGAAGPVTELNTSNRNKSWADGDSLSSVSYSDGDRIVFKPGFSNPNTGSTPEASNNYGDNFTDTDLPENETQTTAGLPWIEFSATLTFAAPTLTRLANVNGTGTTLATGSVNPSVGSFVFLFVTNGASAAATPGGTWAGGSWSQFDTYSTGSRRGTVYTANVTSSSTGTVSVTYGVSQDITMMLVELIGGNPSSPFVQSKVAGPTTTEVTVTLDASADASRAMLGVGFDTDSSGTIYFTTTGWGDVYQATIGGSSVAALSFCQRGQTTGTFYTSGAAMVGWVFEIAGASAATYVPADHFGTSGMFGA